MAPMVPFGVHELASGIMGNELIQHYLKRTENNMGLLVIQALKEMLIIPSTSHVDLYDNKEKILFDKIETFFKTNLK